ncbi:MAG: thymidylate synthase [Candidatus Paceibacterota bacterium]
MKQYLELLEEVLEEGDEGPDRTGVGTKSLFGKQMKFDMEDGFPAVTTKELKFKKVKAELLWFLEGTRDIKSLQEKGCHIWDANVENWEDREFETDAGRIYGVQWRHWKTSNGKEVDQIKKAINKINSDDWHSRQNIVVAFNPGELDQMALPPCHYSFQLRVSNGSLDLLMTQRSADMFLGVPFNIASYSLLLHMIAQITGYRPGTFVHSLGDTHIYLNHIEQVEEQLDRPPYPRPELKLNPAIKDIDNFTMDDIELKNYKHHPHIKAPMAV